MTTIAIHDYSFGQVEERHSPILGGVVFTAQLNAHRKTFSRKASAVAWLEAMHKRMLKVAFGIVNDAVHGEWGEDYTRTGEAVQLAVDITGVQYAALARMWHKEYKEHA